MNDPDIRAHIEALVREEHALLERAEAAPLVGDEHARLAAVNVQLDQYYDLLRQRRARRDAGQDTGLAHLRAPKTVENYEQ